MSNPLLNFKNPQEAAPSAVMLTAILVLSGSLAYMLAVPNPTTDGLARGKERSRKQLLEQIEVAQANGAKARAQGEGRLWKGDVDTITASVLQQLTQEAGRRKVKLAAFRPQRLQNLPELTELPFSVQISGPYPAVHAFAATLDAPQSKLALRSVQVASSDGGSNAVTATLGLSAFIPALPSTTTTQTTKGGTTRG